MESVSQTLKRIPLWGYLAIAAGLLVLQALVLWWLGQPAVYLHGPIKFWVGTVIGPENSQQITDWYTVSHILHGFIFFWLATLLWPKTPLGMRLLVACGVEITWEVLENSPLIIERYRATGLAQGYSGDTILNSISDTVAMALGFFAAYKLPVRVSLFIVIAAELVSLYFIRDGLTLNVINLLWPLDFIQNWQLQAAQ